MVLGPIIEEALSTTIMRSYSSSLPDLLVFSPMSLLFITLSAVSLLVPVYLARRKGGAGSGGSWRTPNGKRRFIPPPPVISSTLSWISSGQAGTYPTETYGGRWPLSELRN